MKNKPKQEEPYEDWPDLQNRLVQLAEIYGRGLPARLARYLNVSADSGYNYFRRDRLKDHRNEPAYSKGKEIERFIAEIEAELEQ
jgi:hypothetical protein